AKPVDKGQALSILETLLSWTGNALVRQGERYLVVPAGQAVAGQLTPQRRIPAPGGGLSARLFTLDYISAVEMRKLLTPFARENAFLLVDPARNALVMAGTPDELSNYQDTIDTFDLNWLKGMSIGVYGLERANVAELMPELNQLFGPRSNTPLAGMVRFLPIERTNAIVAISSQPEYLNEVGRWIDTIDQGGGYEPQMYVYDVRNMKASDLARYLRQIYANEPVGQSGRGQVAPGLRTLTLSSGGKAPGTSAQGGMGSLGSGLSTGGAQEMAMEPRVSETEDEALFDDAGAPPGWCGHAGRYAGRKPGAHHCAAEQQPAAGALPADPVAGNPGGDPAPGQPAIAGADRDADSGSQPYRRHEPGGAMVPG
ncbi:secretin N-terminal domain-containing protein, partial [Pseudomonas brassicae]|uniref:secretin N-terminal domain-containing protein n=1 Tax=Pseudomonas brassicae TaxID=2708063 RepID=UPI003B75CA76